MRGAQQHKNNAIPTIRLVTCPACNKDRLGKYEETDGSIPPANTDIVTVRGEERYLEVCEFCIVRYQKADKQFVAHNMRKLARSLKDTKPEDQSDHKDFSLN